MTKIKPEKVTAIATAVIAFSTVVGVGGALAYYFAQIKPVDMWNIVFMEIA